MKLTGLNHQRDRGDRGVKDEFFTVCFFLAVVGQCWHPLRDENSSTDRFGGVE